MITLSGGTVQQIYGRIRLDVGQFRRDAQELSNLARSAGENIKRSMDTAAKSADQLPNRFEAAGKAIKKAQVALLAFTGAASVLGFAGLQAADNLDALNNRYVQLTGSQREATKMMDQMAASARRLGVPVRGVQKEFLTLVPAVTAAGEDLDHFIDLAIRLSTIDPTQGIEGAIYAIREALSSGGSDLLSLSRRFELPKKELGDLIKSTGSFGEGLDTLLNRYGATTKAAEDQGRTLRNLTAVIRDNIVQVLEKAFAPILEHVRDLFIALNKIITETDPRIIQVGATVVFVVGGFSALALAVQKVAEAFTLVKAAAGAAGVAMLGANKTAAAGSFLSSAGRIAGQAGVLAGAGAVGVAGGLGIVNVAGRVFGDERAANYKLDDAFTTLKQIVFIIGSTLFDAVGTLSKIIAFVVTAFENVGNGFSAIFQRVKIAFGEFLFGLGGVITAIGEFVGRQGEGAGLQREGERLSSEGAIELNRLLTVIATSYETRIQSIDKQVLDLKTGLRDFLFPAEQQIAEVKKETRNWLEETILGIRDNIRASQDARKEAESIRFAAGLDNQIQLLQELNDLVKEGDFEEVNQRVDALENEREAIQQLLPQLREYAEYSEEAAEKLTEYTDRLREINQAIPQYAEALEAATQRALVDNAIEYQKTLAEAEKERSDAVADVVADAVKDVEALNKDDAGKRAELLKREQDIVDDYYDAAAEAEEEHRRKMLDIQRTFAEEAELAASELNAAGVAAAIARRDEATREANEELADAQSANSERRQEQIDALNEERAELNRYYDERMAEILANQQEELFAIQADYDTKAEQARLAREAERTLINTSYQQQLADIQLAVDAERQIRQTAYLQFVLDAQNAANRLMDIGRQMIGQALDPLSANVAGAAISTAFGAVAATTVPALVGGSVPAINVFGVTDPIQVAEVVRQKLMDILGRT